MPTFPATLLVLLLALVHCVTSNTTYSTCYTKRATTSKASVGSTTYALTLTKTASQTITSTPSKTVTPSTSTATFSASVTSTFTVTASQVTDTFSTTTTIQVAETDTVTFLTTTTFLTSTTTVPAASGFTPLGAYVSGVNQKRSLNGRFDIRAAATTTQTCVKKGSDGRPTHSPALYPSTVTCGVLVIATKTATKTITASTTTTLTAATPISTVSTTLIFSTTSTVLLVDASTTTTLSTTMISTTLTTIFPTTTVTSTSTVTQQAPASTAYAQCQSNNIVTNVNGNGISQVDFLVSEFFTTVAVSSAACCVLCAQSATCVTYSYFGANDCELQTRADGVCQGNAAVNAFFTQPQTDYSYAIGNGVCGQYAFSGVS
ncbi:hypothetical protein B0A54_16117 [Friedmanniomyces endolithicus]|uniref:Apple domain-containing protein n=1 Tax=Friedmanniomyces endolithicus TaxID=329885 RepID=A0A4U0U0K4_9PEZI|nr:hypothetical protein B0A54_16117 [Friedmanniomyces endolithicus]